MGSGVGFFSFFIFVVGLFIYLFKISGDTFLHLFTCLFIDRPTQMVLLGNAGNS